MCKIGIKSRTYVLNVQAKYKETSQVFGEHKSPCLDTDMNLYPVPDAPVECRY